MNIQMKTENTEELSLKGWFDYLGEMQRLEQNKDSYQEFVRRCKEVSEGDYNEFNCKIYH